MIGAGGRERFGVKIDTAGSTLIDTAGAFLVGQSEQGFADSALPVEIARARGIQFGVAFDNVNYTADAAYAALLVANADVYTPENEMKPSRVWTSASTWDYSDPDDFIAVANADNKLVRGHTLMYPDHDPAWVAAGVNSGNWEALIDAHIGNMVSRYPSVIAWDVVNEVMTGTGAPNPNGFKDSPWYDAAGEAFVAFSFQRARHYNSTVPLYYCDNATEQGSDSFRNALRTNIINMLDGLLDAGVDVTGFASQCHLKLDYDYRSDRVQHREFLKTLRSMGLKVIVTEVDVRKPGSGSLTDTELDRQASELVRATLDTFLEYGDVDQVHFWNWTDDYQAWGAGERPLPLDTSNTPKPMYYDLRRSLMGA